MACYVHQVILAFNVRGSIHPEGHDITPQMILSGVSGRISTLNKSDDGAMTEWLDACLPVERGLSYLDPEGVPRLWTDTQGCRMDEHPLFVLADWRREVANGETVRGYLDWVNSQIEQRSDDLRRQEDESSKEWADI